MSSIEETPAVPPMDPGGDERVGRYATGGVLLGIGWGLGVVGNAFVHAIAPSSGLSLGPVVVFHQLGTFAWVTFGIGLFTGLLGLGLLWIASEAPKGPIVLPGFDYPSTTSDPSGATAEAVPP